MDIVSRPDEDILIFNLKLGRTVLSDAMLTYEDLDTGRYYVPLTDMMQALEFPIDVDDRKGTAEGWFINENRTFNLSLSQGTIKIKDKETPLKAENIELHEDGIYVSLDFLESWFPITVDIDYSNLAIVIKSLEPLPVEIRKARDQGRDVLGRYGDKALLPTYSQDPPIATIPFADISLQSNFEDSKGKAANLDLAYTALFSSSLLYQDVEASVNGSLDNSNVPDVRLKIGRKDPESNLLGPLNASEYSIGDVTSKRIPIISGSQAGRGLLVTNKPIGYSLDGLSNTITLRGELPTGYQVDLNRNGELLGFVDEPNEDREYVFEEITVFAGLNIFELVFYGPQGQVETKEERVFIDDSPLEKGQVSYEAYLTEDGKNLFTSRSNSDDDTGKVRTSLLTEYGVTDNVSAYSALTSYSMDGKRHDYALLGSGFSFKGIRFNLAQAFSSVSGTASSARAQGIFKDYRWQLQHQYYRDFISEETESSGLSGQLEHETNLRIAGLLPIVKNIPFSLNLDRFSDDAGDSIYNWQFRFTNSFSKLRLTSEIDQTLESDQARETNYSLQINSRLGRKVNLRGDARFSIEPESALDSITLTADYNIDDIQNLRVGISRSGSSQPVHTLSLGYSRDLGFADVGTSVTYNDDNEITALLNASFGFAYDKVGGRQIASRSYANTAGLGGRVFVDNNANGLFDDTDDPVEGASFEGIAVARQHATNENGYVFIPGLEPYTRVPLRVNTSTLPDPFMLPTVEDSDYVLRPGQILRRDFPVQLFGEVDGDIFLFKKGNKKGASSIIVDILNDDDEILVSGRTEFDGFLLIQRVPIGTYKLRANPKQIRDLGFCPLEEQTITLTQEEPFATIDEITLYPVYDSDADQVWVKLINNLPRAEAEEEWERLEDLLAIAYEEELVPIYKTNDSNILNLDLILGPFYGEDAIELCTSVSDFDVMCEIQESPRCDSFQ
jgi:hypothetical protein